MAPQKREHKRECKICKFNCIYMCDLIRHNKTQKHIINQQKTHTKRDKQDKILECEECNKIFQTRSGLWRHRKKCEAHHNQKRDGVAGVAVCVAEVAVCKNTMINQNNIENSDIVENADIVENQDNADYKSMFLDAMSQNKEIMELLKEQSKTIQEMVPKIGNNNNNTTNNKFNLQVFLNEDCKDAINFSEFIENIEVTEEDLENQAQLGYVSGISKLFLENLKELGTNKRPIHCTDKKRNTLYIKEDNEWDKEGSQDQMKQGIFKVQCKTFQRLCAIKDENQEEYSDMDSDFSVKCLNIQRHLTPGYQREITIGKIIDKVSTNSTIDREPDTQI